MDTTVSVIVPAYNVEDYLPRCLDSLLAQTFRDFELILVDDGSSDATGAICDRYGETDARVRVLHQANAGVSAARNRALEIASGTFITFVDADDTTDPTYLERLYTGMQDTGADIASVNWLDTNGRNAYDAALAGADGVRLYTQDELSTLSLLGSCCGRMFRRASLVQLFLTRICFTERTHCSAFATSTEVRECVCWFWVRACTDIRAHVPERLRHSRLTNAACPK